MKICKKCGESFFIKNREGKKNFSKRIFCSKKCVYNSRPKIHGFYGTKIYRTYHNIKARCNNNKSLSFKWYGGKGIKVEWNSFEEFKKDMYDSYKSHMKKNGVKNTTIERINSKKNYCKENCRWATMKEQQNNRTNNHLLYFNNKYLNISEWSKITGLGYHVIHGRITKYGWSIKRALTTPINN